MFKTGKSIIFHPGKNCRSGFGLLLAVCLGAAFLLSAGCATKAENNVAGIEQEKINMEEQWGVKVESLRTSANGHLLDFRYRIKDPDKAVPLVDRRNKPYLIDQASGKVLAVPNTAKVGPLRSSVRYGKPKQDRVYFVLFGNPGLVKPGDQVTVVIGDFRAENLTVE
jgi:hypothetical protein